MSAMGNEFSGLPMADLIGAPLTAACNAQVMLAKATADFIHNVGFTSDDSTGGGSAKKLVPRQVEFSFWRPAQKSDESAKPSGKSTNPSSSEDTYYDVERVALSVPLLAIVNVPALMVKSVDITFDMEVKMSESSKETSNSEKSGEASARAGWGPFSAEVKVSGKVSTSKENTRTSDKSAKYHVEVHARDDGMPEGLSRVLDMMQSSIAPMAVSKSGSAKETKMITEKSLPSR